MFESKYSNFLTIILVIVIIAILGLLAFLGYDIYKKYYINKSAEEAVSQFEGKIQNDTEENNQNSTGKIENPFAGQEGNELQTNNKSTSAKSKPIYKGFAMVGTIEIPKTKIKYPILESVTKKSLETSVAILYGPGLNEIGNTVIVGHNYRNNLFFSKNAQISVGDKIYITDITGRKIEYEVYNTYVTNPEDADYIARDTNNTREISLSTCTDDSSGRIIIWAREKQQ